MVREKPMASGPDPLKPVLSESHVAKTVNTSTNVTNSSIPNVCPSEIPSLGLGVHSDASIALFVERVLRPLRTPAPTTAPSVCTTMYSNALDAPTSSVHTINDSVMGRRVNDAGITSKSEIVPSTTLTTGYSYHVTTLGTLGEVKFS